MTDRKLGSGRPFIPISKASPPEGQRLSQVQYVSGKNSVPQIPRPDLSLSRSLSALSNSTKILGQQPECCSNQVSRDNCLSHCVRMCICVYVCETSLSASNPNSTVMLYRILPSFSFTHKHSHLCETHRGLVFLVRQVLTVAYEHFRRQALGDCGRLILTMHEIRIGPARWVGSMALLSCPLTLANSGHL